MIPFKGCLGFKWYMRDKPVSWGIKVWVLAGAKNGYLKNLQIYSGRDESGTSNIGLCSRVVLNLMDGLENTGSIQLSLNLVWNHLQLRGGKLMVHRKVYLALPSFLITKCTCGVSIVGIRCRPTTLWV